MALLNAHVATAHAAPPPQAQPVQQQRRTPRVDRPVLSDNITEETWNAFEQSWNEYVSANGVQNNEKTVQLYSCCDMPLKAKLTAMNPSVVNDPVDTVLTLLKTLTVIPVAKTVKRNELLQMQQDAGEGIRTFLSRVKGKAVTCSLQKECSHPHANDVNNQPPPDHVLVDFTDEWIRHVILNGMYDDEIRRDVFGHHNLDTLDVNSLVTLIEGKETARDATREASNNAFSQQRRHHNDGRGNRDSRDNRDNRDNCDNRDTRNNRDGDSRDSRVTIDRNERGNCGSCGTSIKLWKKMSSGRWNKTAFTNCQECWKKNKSQQSSEASAITFDISGIEEDEADEAHVEPDHLGSEEPPVEESSPIPDELIKEFSTEETQSGAPSNVPSITPDTTNSDPTLATPESQSSEATPQGPPTTPDAEVNAPAEESATTQLPIELPHHVFKNGQWCANNAKPHPSIRLTAFTRQKDYEFFGLKHVAMKTQDVDAVTDSGAQVCLWGWSACSRAGFRRKDLIATKQRLNGVNKKKIRIYGAILLRMYGMTEDGERITCVVMVYVSPDVTNFYLSEEAMLQLKIIPQNFPHVGSAASITADECPCTPRTDTPGRPQQLPMEARAENIQAMEQWLRSRYASSIFNCCPHQPIPSIKGPPLRIHVDPNAEPKQAFTRTPLHWIEETDADLEKDVAMKVIEKVPHDESPRWIHRCVYTRKSIGKVRRTVDLSPLNKHCMREAYPMKSPFELAKGIPPNTWRTVTDAFNGYHSVPLHPEDRHLTTFSTNKGLFRYLRAPQGFASSGDGYNCRLDHITADFVRYSRITDDGCHYDDHNDLELHWWRTIDLLELMGTHGVTLNPKKLQFCKKEIDFAGFRLTESTVSPLPKYLDSIRHFPTPKSITDIRAWFGLVNQVSHYAQLRRLVEPFRKFLSPKEKFYWNNELNDIFEASKEAIIKMIQDGVQIFDIKRKTCLRCDWSQEGIGYYLMQKHCSCDSNCPDCCEDGWRVTLCGSRFMKKAETRYAPIEGEALAVAWALEQTKFFTLGCNNLVVVVDHKPLTKVLGDRTLDEISNPRLFRIKQRTLPWIYDIYWMPGKCNSFSDAISRQPATDEPASDDEASFVSLMNSFSHSDNDGHPVQCDIIDDSANPNHIAALAMSNLDKVFAITWERVQSATFVEYENLVCTIQRGFPTSKCDLDAALHEF